MAAQLRTLEEQAQSLANYLPGGKLFNSANIHNSNFRKLIRGLAGELVTADGNVRLYQQEILPDETVLFIDEWEQAVGIPDSCFPGTGDLDERRLHVLIKLASLGVQTAQDFIDLAALFGIVITVRSGHINGVFPMVFPWIFFDSEKTAHLTIIVTCTVQEANRYAFTFPFLFGDNVIFILECLFRKLIPANCDIIFEQV